MKRFDGAYTGLIDQLVRARTGLEPARRLAAERQRLFGAAMARAGVSDEAVYVALLKRDNQAFDELIADLTVPESYFFRDPPHFELLRHEVVRALANGRKAHHIFQFWSAGCAGGEEPYSLVMLLEQESLAERGRVLGTDISRRALGRAARAVYPVWSLRATSQRDLKRYFEPCGRDFRVIERIRKRVRWQQHNLSSPIYPQPEDSAAGFDLILCRNVLIYFEPNAIEPTAQRLARSLAEDGWLMTGPSDPLLEIDEWCDTVRTPLGVLYRRRGARVQPRPLRAQSVFPPDLGRGARAAGEPRPEPARVPAAHARRPEPSSDAGEAEQRPSEEALQAVGALARSHGAQPAEVACRELLTEYPLAAELHALQASLLIDLGRQADAEQALRRALYLDRSLALAHLLQAAVAERRGDTACAVRAYLQLSTLCRARPADEQVPLADGMTHEALASLADQRSRALQARGAR